MFDVADGVLEPDEVRVVVSESGDGLGRVDGVGAVVDNDADVRGFADRGDVFVETVLVAFGEVGREDEDAFGACSLGIADVADGLDGRTARGGQDRDLGA